MIFTETKLKGAFLIRPDLLKDNRGFFARTWCKQTFEEHKLNSALVQCNVSFNRKKGTVRGMHYQAEPYGEAKLIRCISGSIYDVIIDLRRDSLTFLKWSSVLLTKESYEMLYIPEGFAHGFQTLEENTEIFYQMSEFYHPEFAKGIRWNDPFFDIKWPLEKPLMSEKDASYPLFDQNLL